MSRCIAVFLDFAYMARQSEHDTVSFDAMREANEAGAGSTPNRFPGLRDAGVLNAAVGGNTHNLPTRPQRGALRG